MTKEFLFEIFKWIISSVVIVIVTLIIDTGFKERTAGIQEMQIYDKYVDIILKADNIEQRWKLCQYFSIVTPTERLRSRWQAYKDSIQSDYFAWKKTQPDTLEVDLNNESLLSTQNSGQAKLFEERAFTSLINRDVETAIILFQKTDDISNGYHNCWEIHNFLIKNRVALTDPKSAVWNELFTKISRDWSWGLSKELKQKIQTF